MPPLTRISVPAVAPRGGASAARSATPTRCSAAPRRGTPSCGSLRGPRRGRSCSSHGARARAARRPASMPSPSSSTRIELLAAHLHRDRDARRAGVDGVLDEFLDDRRRALHHLAGGDLVGEFGRELADLPHGAYSQRLRRKNQSSTPDMRRHDAEDPPELGVLAAGEMHERARSSRTCPVSTVIGMKIDEKIVRNFITSLRRFDTFDRCASRMADSRSWNSSASSEMRTTWS